MKGDQRWSVGATGGSAATAKLEAGVTSEDCAVKIGGEWRLNAPVPSWSDVLENRATSNVRVVPDGLGRWDTSLLLFLVHGRAWCAKAGRNLICEALPGNLQELLRQTAGAAAVNPETDAAGGSVWLRMMTIADQWATRVKENVSFVGECTLGFFRALANLRRFRWMDLVVEMQQCWGASLPMVGLVSFLVGVILAFQAAIQLQQYGAAVFVADLVGLSVVREMGPMMAAVIVAGGTGARYAAQLGNMKVDEEIDALETLGISSVDFLAVPRLLAGTIMMPFLALYANVLGILGGMFVSASMLEIPASAYWSETQNRVGPSDVASGLIKSVFFGLAVGLAGCLRGFKCERNAVGVGRATSSAVVTGILLIVLGDAVFALLFNVLGI